MPELNTQPNLADPDAFYAKLIGLHEGLSLEDSLRVNARLILLLANHIGDAQALEQAITLCVSPRGRAAAPSAPE